MSASSTATVRGLAACENQLDVIDHKDAAGTTNVLVILGNGFFVVRDPVSNESYATQTTHFILAAKGCLVTNTGARVQGCTDGGLSTLGDIQINTADLPPASTPGAAMLCYSIDCQGKITVHLCDGTSFLRGQILLQNFQDPQALISEGNELYSNMSAAGPLPALAAPGSHGLGSIQWGVLELSNAGANVCRAN